MGWHEGPVGWREYERRLSWRRDGEPGGPPPGDRGADGPGHTGDASPPHRRLHAVQAAPAGRGRRWAELHVHSSYSFLDGASDPAALVAEAARLEIGTLALTDHDGMYGAVQFARAARAAGIATVFGAELSLDLAARQGGVPDPAGRHLLVLARDADGYRRLCAAIGAAQLAGGEKGRPRYDMADLAAAAGGHWAILTGCRKGAVPAALAAGGERAALGELHTLIELFGRDNVFVELIDQELPLDDARGDALHRLAGRAGTGVVASGNVHYARPADARLAAVLAALRARRSLDEMASWLPGAATAHLRSGAERAARLTRFPGVAEATAELGACCAFDFDLLAPKLPDRHVPEGRTEPQWLRELTMDGAAQRYGPPEAAPEAYRQIEYELGVITELGFPGYFLIVHDIVRFCRERGILCQGRGSAANSVVCYVLGITNADPIAHRLLFERFLAPGREGPPDIDLDIEHRRRERVIQYVYDAYGRGRAAQVANVISYRPKMALRDAAKALGHSPGRQDAWARQVGPAVGVAADPAPGAAAVPVPDDTDVPADVAEIAGGLLRLPRHLGIHSGGMVLCDRPIAQVCPVEWATMPGRSVLQWDKDDCAAAGLVKFDLLGLGMLSALHDAFDLVAAAHGRQLDLASIPAEDPATYAMLRDADSVGVFQVESRAQMATLPRLRPEKFYDLVVEVALIRPGPIQGGSVHPYLRRRHGREPVDYPHPLMKRALERTLGVPLFQEQMMQLATDCAGFTPAESDRLRQAMSAKRAPERIAELHDALLAGMAERGIGPGIAEQVYEKILGFSGFGFPESHAISFAHLVYASAWLKRHYPAAFTAALLRNQPMGFYHPATLLADARRHGIRVHGVDAAHSDVEATLEWSPEQRRDAAHSGDAGPSGGDPHPHASDIPQPAIRLGLSSVRAVPEDAARAIVTTRPHADLEGLVRATALPLPALEALATAGAFGCFGLARRAALWAVGALAGTGPGTLPGTASGAAAPALPAMTPVEETLADLWATGTSPVHPIAHVRTELRERGAVPACEVKATGDGATITVAGLVTHRQHPGTAGGVVFLNLEDETGMVNVICPDQVWRRHRRIATESAALLIRGTLEHRSNVANVLAARIAKLPVATIARSR